MEDKYQSILDRYARRKDGDAANNNYKRACNRVRTNDNQVYVKDELSPFTREEKTLEPEVKNRVVLSEKAYPYVSTSAVKREKTPGRHKYEKSNHLTADSVHRYGRHKSGHTETKSRKVRPLHRSGKSEQLEGTCAISKLDTADPDRTPTQRIPETIQDEAITEREAKRKEIQGLIMKYAAIEEAYAKNGGEGKPSAADIIASKYQKKCTVADGVVDESAIVSCRGGMILMRFRGFLGGCDECLLMRV